MPTPLIPFWLLPENLCGKPGSLRVHVTDKDCCRQGLAAEVEAIQALVVSEETAAGLGPINEDRRERGFAPLEVQFSPPFFCDQPAQWHPGRLLCPACAHCSCWCCDHRTSEMIFRRCRVPRPLAAITTCRW